MCTVTFLPLETGFVITQNRDESPMRAAEGLVRSTCGDQTLVFPKDRSAGGSWISICSNGRVACLLNGAFRKHKHHPPYRKSRGLILLDYFKSKGIQHFVEQYTFVDIEPFTMIVVESEQLFEFRWDGVNRHLVQLSFQESHIWSSCTLYPPTVQDIRAQWFGNWQKKQTEYNPENILTFHQTAGQEDKRNGLVMNRDNVVRTVSITSVVKDEAGMQMQFYDLLQGKEYCERMDETATS